jgi:CHAD domain-containing protein
VRDVIARAVATSAIRLFSHDPGVRIGGDPEFVHQARVAARRLRSDLRTFRAQLEAEWNASLREELRRVGEELGAVRDAEVLRDRLAGRATLLSERDRKSATRLLARLDRAHAQARDRLRATFDDPRYLALLDRLVEAAHSPAVLDEVAGLPAVDSLGSVVERPWNHLRESVKRVTADPTDELLHAVRIRAKRARYAAEAVGLVFGDRAHEFADIAAELQDVLGEHQDSVVARRWLREAAAASGPVTAFTAGELAALESRAAVSARAQWPDVWMRLSKKNLRFWR